jgi:sugar lactone lactonase YvrE
MAHVGKATTLTVTFSTSDGAPASHLSVTHLGSQLPRDWSSGVDDFTCLSVSVGTGCVLHLQYLPAAIEQGVATLAFSYLANNGVSKTSAVNIAYSSSWPALKLLAGSIGSYGNADGTGDAAHFGPDATVAVDTTGTIFLADGSAVRKITADGTATTLTGGNGFGNQDGAAGLAQFGTLSAIASGPGGNVYVTDSNYYTVRKIAADGTTTTLVNSVVVAGPNPSNDLSVPYGVAADSAGYVYVADDWGTILKVSPAGSVTTLAGLKGSYGSVDGVGPAARFTSPKNLAIDPSGNLFVIDAACAVRRITPSGSVTTLATKTGACVLSGVTATGAGEVYVSEAHALLKVNAAGGLTVVAGTEATGGFGDSAHPPVRFSRTEGCATAPNGTVLVADDAQIRKVSTSGVVTTLAGSPGCRPWDACYLPYIASDRFGNVYATSRDMFQLVRIDPTGAVTSLPRLPLAPQPDYMEVKVDDIAIDTHGTLYAALTARSVGLPGAPFTSSWIVTLAPDGTTSTINTRVPFAFYSVALDASGNIYASSEDCVYRIAPNGTASILAGQPGVPGSADGSGSAAQFGPVLDGIAVDPGGEIYVSDTSNQTVREISPTGAVTTVAGQAGSYGSDDGPGQIARFSMPRGLAVDAQGNVFVVDQGSYNASRQYAPLGPWYGALVRRVGTDGTVSTVAGNRQAYGIVPGPLPAFLNMPTRVALRSDGELVIGDGSWMTGVNGNFLGGAILVTDGF